MGRQMPDAGGPRMTNLADTMPFSKLMGVEVTESSKERVIGKLVVREDLCTAGGILHGGAIMAFADALGAIGGFLNLEPGTRTTTLESKTNFLGAAPVGMTVTGETTPVHVGKKTSVWSTRITNDKGKPIALVLQTQITV
jgi:1,4-dihydroxy-2-naphthoyl-CoA hydrolase